MGKTILYFVALFFLLRFVLRFVLPLLRLTSETSKRMRQMQEELSKTTAAQQAPKRPAPKEDYIEYEEVK